ncbi:MAG: hypothetical protein ACYTBV_18640 [Planctomycetota bacterium]
MSALVDGPFDDSYSDTPITVASNLTFNVPAGVPQGAVVWLPFTGSFSYNGTDNLILEVETTDNGLATETTKWWNRFGSGVPYYRIFGELGSATGTAAKDYYFAKFRFTGGTMDVNPAVNSGSSFPFWSVSGRDQWIYRASELGTAGEITSIACRMNRDIPADTGFDYSIILNHAPSILSTTFDSNIAGGVTVYDSVFDTPAMLDGDWVTINFSNAFSYNGTDDLLVEWRGTGGTGGQADCRMTNISGSDSRLFGSNDATSTAGTWLTQKMQIRFEILKDQ